MTKDQNQASALPTDAEANDILSRMSEHVDNWADRLPEEPSAEQCSGEALRFIIRALATPAQQTEAPISSGTACHNITTVSCEELGCACRHGIDVSSFTEAPKDHVIAHMVNRLRDVAIRFHDTQQLRERIAGIIVPVLKAPHGSEKDAERYRWLRSEGFDRPAKLWATTVSEGNPVVHSDLDDAIDAAIAKSKEPT